MYFYHTAALWVNLFQAENRTHPHGRPNQVHLWMIITVYSFPFCLCHDNCEVDKSFGEKWSQWLWVYLGNCCKGHAKEELQMSNSHLWSSTLYRIWQFLWLSKKSIITNLSVWNFCSSGPNWALMDLGSSDKTCVIVVLRCYLEQTPLTFCLTECPFRV